MKKRSTNERRQQPRRIPAKRHWAYRFMTLALVFVLGELIAFTGLALQSGRIDYWSANQNLRKQILMSEQTGTQLTPVAAREADLQTQEVHPYLGYTEDPTRFAAISQYGFDKPFSIIGKSSIRQTSEGNYLPQRKPGRLIIAVLGGSVARDFSELGILTLVEKLRSHEAFREMEIQIVPLALGGFKQPQQLFTLNYFLNLGAEFDLVINIDGFNEVALHEAENGKKGVFYAYPRSWSTRTINLPDATLLRLREIKQQRVSWASLGSSRLLRYSAIWNVIWQLGDHKLISEQRKAIMEHEEREASNPPRYQATGPNRQYADRKQLYQELVRIWERSSVQLQQISRANDIGYFHFLQPNQYVAGSKPMSPEERAIAMRDDHPYRSGAEFGYPLLIKAGERLKKKGVRFYDLTRVFENHSEPIYRDDCCHYSTKGNQILAQRIAEVIIDSRVHIRNSKSSSDLLEKK